MQELALTQKYTPLLLTNKLATVSQNIKLSLLEKVQPYLSSVQADLVSGMVFGGAGQLPQDLQRSFRVTGLTHVVSASGYNVSVVAGLALAVLARFLSKANSALAAVVIVWVYAHSADLVPPVMRASLMITINLIGSRVFFKQYHLKFCLLLTAAIMLLFKPDYALSLSFWLSLLATTGIILILPLLEQSGGVFSRLATGQIATPEQPQKSHVITESLLVTIAAQSLTLPLVAVVFGEISLLSLVTNTLLLWLTPVITLSGLGLMGLGVLLSSFPGWWEQVAPVLSLVVWLPTQLFLASVSWFGQFEWGLIELSFAWWMAGCWWLVLMVLIWRKQRCIKL